ncbi:MAG: hypothetical protein ACXWC9_08350 [Pseudobdellovibrionaceae bacterium]
MEKKVIVYQAYGSDDILQQTGFSILSLLKQTVLLDDLDVWIYTDKKTYFENLFGSLPNLKLIEITLDQINKWRGPVPFVHRVKIEILRDAASRFKGSLFYCDGDTYFQSEPSSLFNKVNERTSLMHLNEGALDETKDPLSKKILKFTKKHHFQISNELVGIGPSTEMWNAGFLGIAEKNKSLLPLILELTDQTYALYQKHVMEQLSFSLYLQTRSEILTAKDVVYHYWNQKDEYQLAINTFLSSYPDAQSALQNWSQFQAPKTPLKRKKEPLFTKILGRRPR